MDVVEGCVDIINRAQFPDADVWIAALQQGVSEAFISIFISQLSMLNCLRLDYEFLKSGYADKMVKHALLPFSSFPQGVLSIFSRLQKVDYGRHNHDSPSYIHKWLFNDLRGYDKNKFIAWLCLPSLQRFDTHYLVLTGVTGLERRQREEDIKLNLRGLQTLFLTRSKIPEQDILFLLSQTPSLKNLHLGPIYERHDQPVPGHHLLAQALESVSDAVENLSIGVEYYSCCGECEEVEDDKPREEGLESWEPFRGILKRFTNLQNLEIPIYVIFGTVTTAAADFDLGAALPETLRKLCLRNNPCQLQDCEMRTGSYILDCVHAFLTSGNWKSATPFLRNICIRLCPYAIFKISDPDDPESLADSEKQLQDVCEREGIEMKVYEHEYSVPIGDWIPAGGCCYA